MLLSDDLNFSDALGFLHGLHKSAKSGSNASAAHDLASSLSFLGLWGGEQALDVFGYGYAVTDGPVSIDVEPLIAARLEARKAKNWAESDRIRDELAAMGIAIKDNKDGTTSWEAKR